MTILSIDCGVINFAYVVYETKSDSTRPFDANNLLELQCITLTNRHATIKKTTHSLYAQLSKIHDTYPNLRHVLIEQQTPRNIRMTCMSHCVNMFFLVHGISVEFCNPRNTHKRLHLLKGSEKRDYKCRKNDAKAHASMLLSDNAHHLAEYMKFKKRDDIADCLLQLAAHLL